jgi:lysophospholipase L1-like esterase
MFSILILFSYFQIVLCLQNRYSFQNLHESGVVNLIGRFDSGFRADWPGIGFSLEVSKLGSESSQCMIEFSGEGDPLFYINVLIDGISQGSYEVSKETNYVLNLEIIMSIGNHVLSFIRQTEADYSTASGITQPLTIQISGISLSISRSSANKIKFLFFGDSVTAAYGVDGTSPCTFTPATENFLHGYATLVTNYFSAEYQTVAWSGKGVVRNYGSPTPTSPDPLPLYYNRTIATDPSSYWIPSNYPADMVYVMLGSNDYSTEPVPSDSQFVDGLVNFVNQIKFDYPKALVITACAPSAHGNQCANIEKAAAITGIEYLYIDPSVLSGGYGCDDHPDCVSQQNISLIIISFLQPLLSNVFRMASKVSTIKNICQKIVLRPSGVMNFILSMMCRLLVN